MSPQSLVNAIQAKTSARWPGFLIVTIASWAILHPLVDNYFLHVFEGDAQSTVDLTLAFASGHAIFGEPVPSHYPPYFDAQYFIYAAAVHMTRCLLALGVLDQNALPTAQSVGVFAIRYANLTAYTLSASFAFLLCARLAHNQPVGFVLASFLLFSPHMLNIDLVRVDHVVFALLLVTLYLTAVVASEEAHAATHAAYGIVTAALTLTKITSVIFCVLPALVYARRARNSSFVGSGALFWLCAFVAVALIFMARYAVHEVAAPGFSIRVTLEKLADLSRWSTVLQSTPYLYYNWDQFLYYGPVFFNVAMVSIVWLAGRQIIGRRSHTDSLLLLALFGLSILGVVSFKYPRGLYSLLPLYLAVLASTFASVSRELELRLRPAASRGWRSSAFAILWLGVLCAGLLWPLEDYQRLLENASQRAVSVKATRIESAVWLEENLRDGARVTIPIHSEWANPPIDSSRFEIKYRFLEFPYLAPEKMAAYRPPSWREVEESTDVIILNDFHETNLVANFASQGHTERQREWLQFFDDVRTRYKLVRFQSTTPSYGVRRVEIVLINEGSVQN